MKYVILAIAVDPDDGLSEEAIHQGGFFLRDATVVPIDTIKMDPQDLLDSVDAMKAAGHHLDGHLEAYIV